MDDRPDNPFTRKPSEDLLASTRPSVIVLAALLFAWALISDVVAVLMSRWSMTVLMCIVSFITWMIFGTTVGAWVAVICTVLLIVFGAIVILQEDMSTQDAKKKGPLAEDPLQVPVLDAAFLCGEKAP
jgi:hypothetical protein